VQATLPLQDDPFADPDWPYARLDPHADLQTQIAAVVRSMGEWAFDHARELRTLLALSLEPDSEARGLSRRGKFRRDRWINALMADLPNSVDEGTRRRLATALLALFGAEAIVRTVDVAELDRDAAFDTSPGRPAPSSARSSANQMARPAGSAGRSGSPPARCRTT
jgi:hypothetical protein